VVDDITQRLAIAQVHVPVIGLAELEGCDGGLACGLDGHAGVDAPT
jgi:hypothetical protein